MPGALGAVDAERFTVWVKAATRALERHRAAIDALNVFPVPDGDTGTNLWLTMTACQREVEKANGGDLREVAEAAARGALMGARGNSGVILSQFFRGFARYVATLQRPARLDGRTLARALEQAVTVAYEAVIRPVEGTMLTVGREASARAAKAARSPRATVEDVLAAALEGAREALRRTPDLLPVLAEAGVVDAGGQGLVVLLEAARCVEIGEERSGPGQPAAVSTPGGPPGESAALPGHGEGAIAVTELTYRYCTEFLVRGSAISAEKLRQELQPLGDSLLVVGDRSLVKCHVHTNHPGRALEVGLRWGELLSVSVSNMQEQNREAAARAREAFRSQGVPVNPAGSAPGTSALAALRPGPVPSVDGLRPVKRPLLASAVVAVASGAGLTEIFRSLGAEQVVDGGKTMNPSTEDLAAAVERAGADAVLLLPNHPNVLLAARQVQQLSKKRVLVVPTRSIPQGLAATLAFRSELGPDDNAAAMERAMRRVGSGEVTYAVRDSQLGQHLIRTGDLVGMAEGELVCAGPDLSEVVRQVAARLLTEGRTLLTLYYGQEVTSSQAERVAEHLRQQLPGVEVELYYGGQPIYYFLLSAE